MARLSVPEPFLVSPTEPATAELIVAVTPESTVTDDPLNVSVEPVRVYPVVLNVMPLTVCGDPSVTVPALPQKNALWFCVQATSDVPLNHLSEEVSQVPVPPRPAPVDRLLLPALASLSQ